MKIKYIELFSGIGAFSQAIKKSKNVDAACVFAADINKKCADVYKDNYHVDSLHDLTKVDEKDVPKHDFCFFSPPCQAFSKSGKKLGFEDSRGTLIYEVFRILDYHHPKYILMENVRNLVSHDNKKTIEVILTSLHNIGYRTPSKPIILSPHYFGIPQTRERAFLPGIYDPQNADKPLEITFDNFLGKNDCDIDTVLDKKFNSDESLKISPTEEYVLNAWDDFYKGINKKTIGFPIWYDYFYKKAASPDMPDWKIEFINKNKKLFEENKVFIKKWEKKYDYLKSFTPTQRKFEWQAGNKIGSIWDGVIQFRPSGIRVKAPDTLPALVAIVQIPIIGKYKRRLSVRECANMQSFPQNFVFGTNRYEAYKQLGNSINVVVLTNVIEKLLKIS